MNWRPNMKTKAIITTMLMTVFLAGIASGQQKPVTGYAPVNGLKMYYEIKGSGEPVVVLHGAFMAITDDWRIWINELAKTRKVIAVEMQGHGLARRCQRKRIGGKGARQAAENVARKLVQQDHERQATLRTLLPGLERASAGLLIERQEAPANVRIERGVLLEPGLAVAAEPELEHLLRGHRLDNASLLSTAGGLGALVQR